MKRAGFSGPFATLSSFRHVVIFDNTCQFQSTSRRPGHSVLSAILLQSKPAVLFFAIRSFSLDPAAPMAATAPITATLPSAIEDRLPVLLILVAASGCAALIYEVVWYQLLPLAIGSTSVSLGILLAA